MTGRRGSNRHGGKTPGYSFPDPNDKDAVKKYIEERRRRFPTQERIKLAMKEDISKAGSLGGKLKVPIAPVTGLETESAFSMISEEYGSSSEGEVQRNQGPCKYFLQGRCRRGLKCKYSHDLDAVRAGGRDRIRGKRSLEIANILKDDGIDVAEAVKQVCEYLFRVSGGRSKNINEALV